MPSSPARRLAYDVLRRVDGGRDFAVDLLHRPSVSALKEADQRLATEIVMGVLRWRGELDFQIERLARRKLTTLHPEVVTVLRLSVFQIRFLERVPKFAIVDDAVELIKSTGKPSASGLVNAVLRKCFPPTLRLRSTRWDAIGPEGIEAVRRTVPAWLFKRWAARKWPGMESRDWRAGDEAALRLAWASTLVPPTTLRIVGANVSREDVAHEQALGGTPTEPAELGKFALTLRSGNLLASRAFREGRAVIQDEASQLVAELVAPMPGQRVLDLCAAPGMKAGLLAQLLERGTLVVCDHSAPRLATLRKLLPAQMPASVGLNPVRIDAAHELPFGTVFDRILLDAPCSGTGTLARNPEIKWRLKPEDLARFAARQKAMLHNALRALAPASRLVYSTCSLEPEENEQVVESVLRLAPDLKRLGFEELSREFVVLARHFDGQGYFRTNPALDRMDGFFAAVLVRNG